MVLSVSPLARKTPISGNSPVCHADYIANCRAQSLFLALMLESIFFPKVAVYQADCILTRRVHSLFIFLPENRSVPSGLHPNLQSILVLFGAICHKPYFYVLIVLLRSFIPHYCEVLYPDFSRRSRAPFEAVYKNPFADYSANFAAYLFELSYY